MLRWRLILGTAIIATLVALCWLDSRSDIPGAWLTPVALLLTLGASQEIIKLLSASEFRPSRWVVYLGNVLIVGSAMLPHLFRPADAAGKFDGLILITFAITVLLAFVAEMSRYEKPGSATQQAGMTIFCLAYVGVLMAIIVNLRFLLPGTAGLVPLLLLIAVVKFADIGAYTVGRIFGRNKLAPTLSPGKTREGALGALVFGCIAAVAILNGLYPKLAPQAAAVPIWCSILLGTTVGIAGMIGDLAESLIKRDLRRKDSSDWMPGFGGVLDIIDSLLLAAPVAYLGCWLIT